MKNIINPEAIGKKKTKRCEKYGLNNTSILSINGKKKMDFIHKWQELFFVFSLHCQLLGLTFIKLWKMITVLSHVNFMSLSVILHILILGLSLLNMAKRLMCLTE